MPVPPRRTASFRSGLLPVLLLCALLPVLASGCAGRTSTAAIRSDLASGSLETLEHTLEETHESYGEFVTACNLARVYQINGRWADSIKAYTDALTLLEDYESRAVVNARALLAGAGTALFSRGADEYYGAGYERSLLHTFNALNYLMLGDFTGAAVEMRRMDRRQAIWLEESHARIEKHLESEKFLESPEDLPTAYSMRELLRNQEVRGLLNNYQDPFSYALAAVLFRLAGDSGGADVSMRRAMALNDAANGLFSRAWPGKPVGKARADATTQPVVPGLPPVSEKGESADTQEVAVIAFTGLSPALRVENVRLFFPPIGYILVDLPAYARPVYGAPPTVAALRGGDARDIDLHPLLRTDVLAYRTLWDEVRMEIAFAVSRALTRAGISTTAYVAAHSNENTRGYAPLISTLTTVIMDIFSSLMADSVRNWETLPHTGHLALAAVPRGSVVTVSTGSNTVSVDLPQKARGVIIMVTELPNATMRTHHVTY